MCLGPRAVEELSSGADAAQCGNDREGPWTQGPELVVKQLLAVFEQDDDHDLHCAAVQANRKADQRDGGGTDQAGSCQTFWRQAEALGETCAPLRDSGPWHAWLVHNPRHGAARELAGKHARRPSVGLWRRTWDRLATPAQVLGAALRRDVRGVTLSSVGPRGRRGGAPIRHLTARPHLPCKLACMTAPSACCPSVAIRGTGLGLASRGGEDVTEGLCMFTSVAGRAGCESRCLHGLLDGFIPRRGKIAMCVMSHDTPRNLASPRNA